MKKNYFKIAAILLFIGVITTGCGSRRNQPTPVVEGAVLIENIPFSGAARQSDTHWRVPGTAISTQLAMGRRVATQDARTALAQQIETQIRAVAQNYANHEAVDFDTEEANRFQEQSIAATATVLNNARVVDEQVFRMPDGRLEVHVLLEMSKDAVRQGIANRISADDRLRLRFDEYQFRRVFDEEMRNFQNR